MSVSFFINVFTVMCAPLLSKSFRMAPNFQLRLTLFQKARLNLISTDNLAIKLKTD